MNIVKSATGLRLEPWRTLALIEKDLEEWPYRPTVLLFCFGSLFLFQNDSGYRTLICINTRKSILIQCIENEAKNDWLWLGINARRTTKNMYVNPNSNLSISICLYLPL